MKKKNIKKWIIPALCLVIGLTVAGVGTVSAMAQRTAIGEEKAENFAFVDAGVDPATVKDVDADFTYARGQFVYEVEFLSEGTRYEYLIKAEDGTVVKKTTYIVNQESATETTEQKENNTTQEESKAEEKPAEITLEDAKELALADAKVNGSEAVFTEAKLDADDGHKEYDITFRVGNTEYSYEISLAGTILNKDMEVEAEEKPEKPPVNPPTTSIEKITVAQAKEIALKHAGLTASEVTFKKAKLEKDDGVWEYEIEFFKGRMEYEYTIHATTGKILEHDADMDD